MENSKILKNKIKVLMICIGLILFFLIINSIYINFFKTKIENHNRKTVTARYWKEAMNA